MGLFQQLIEGGVMSPEEAEAIIAAADADQSQDISPEELLAYLQEAVQSGQMAPEQADAIAQEYIAAMGGGEAPAAEEAPVAEDAVKSAAAHSAQNVTDLINVLYKTK